VQLVHQGVDVNCIERFAEVEVDDYGAVSLVESLRDLIG